MLLYFNDTSKQSYEMLICLLYVCILVHNYYTTSECAEWMAWVLANVRLSIRNTGYRDLLTLQLYDCRHTQEWLLRTSKCYSIYNHRIRLRSFVSLSAQIIDNLAAEAEVFMQSHQIGQSSSGWVMFAVNSVTPFHQMRMWPLSCNRSLYTKII